MRNTVLSVNLYEQLPAFVIVVVIVVVILLNY